MAGETIERAEIRRHTTVWSVPRPMRHNGEKEPRA